MCFIHITPKTRNNIILAPIFFYSIFSEYDTDKNYGGHTFEEPNKLIEMTLLEFINKVSESRKKLDETYKFSNGSIVSIENEQEEEREDNNKYDYYYLQTSIGSVCELAHDIDNGIDKTNWSECLEIARKCEWGSLMANNLLIGMKGNMIPLNYQTNENIFISLNGYTEIILFSSITTPYLYPFPYGHPLNKQSMVNLEFVNDNDNNKLFKNFNVRNEILNDNIYRAILKPGDVLYIPNGWWSEITNLNDFTMNITFCNKGNINDQQKNGKPDIEQIFNNKTIEQKISIGRNLERIIFSKYGATDNLTTNIFKSYINKDENYTKYRNDITKVLKNVFNEKEIDKFVCELVDGRYDIDFNQFVRRNSLHKIIKKT